MKLSVKVFLVIILVLCIFKMPYGYYQFARIATCAGFLWLAYSYSKQPLLLLPCIGVAILVNPVIKVYFNRRTWNNIDVAIAILLAIWIIVDLVSLLYGKSKEKRANPKALQRESEDRY